MTKADAIIKQFQHEIETWKRILSFLTDENINIKKRLSEILRTVESGDDKMLDRIEYFHNRLLKEDEVIAVLFREVGDQERSIMHNGFEEDLRLRATGDKQVKLRNALEKAEQEFNKLNFEFNSYLTGII